jgi:uncharacterized protein
LNPSASSTFTSRRERRLGLWAFFAIVLVYLVVIQGGGRLIGQGIDSDENLETLGNLLRTTLIPIAISSMLAIGVATWLGWWPQIARETKPVQRWTRIIPFALLAAAVLGASWSSFLDQTAGLIVAVVVLVLIVGFTEELMFRGIGLKVFRDMQLSEGKVALYSSLVFGAVHLSNALATGAGAIGQAIAVSFSGYLFYLTRRTFGSIWPAMLVHASQDFVILSGQVGVDPELAPQALLVIITMIALLVLVIIRRHRIEPEAPAEAVASGATLPSARA